MTEKILVERSVEKYGDNAVLNDINVSISEDDVVYVIGPSGSGKGTFLCCLSQLEEASSGDTIIDGADLTNGNTDTNQVRQHIGMVFQHFNLFPHLSILESIVLVSTDLGRLSKDEAEKKALELLERAGLAGKKDTCPDPLSGGQKQRVVIARALAVNPDIMLFDEPASALDPKMVGDILGVMKNLAKQGIAMIIVTHGMGLAREVTNQVIFINGGNFLENDSPGQIFKNPRNP